MPGCDVIQKEKALLVKRLFLYASRGMHRAANTGG